MLGWRRDEDEEDIWEGDNFNLYEFIKSGKEVPFDDFTDDVLDNLTYQYPSTRWEKGLGDDCKFPYILIFLARNTSRLTLSVVSLPKGGHTSLARMEITISRLP
jgi:hypothetical protein